MNTEIIIVTPEEIRQIFRECLKEYTTGLYIQNSKIEENFVSSISTLADFLKCSRTSAQKFKNKHSNSKIFKQFGRKFIASKSDILSVIDNKQLK